MGLPDGHPTVAPAAPFRLIDYSLDRGFRAAIYGPDIQPVRSILAKKTKDNFGTRARRVSCGETGRAYRWRIAPVRVCKVFRRIKSASREGQDCRDGASRGLHRWRS